MRSDWEETSYKLSAFLETYLAVLEIEWLTHVAIERYVVAKYNTNGNYALKIDIEISTRNKIYTYHDVINFCGTHTLSLK